MGASASSAAIAMSAILVRFSRYAHHPPPPPHHRSRQPRSRPLTPTRSSVSTAAWLRDLPLSLAHYVPYHIARFLPILTCLALPLLLQLHDRILLL
jgi:hypothetical protein